jgi:hypothetical protein
MQADSKLNKLFIQIKQNSNNKEILRKAGFVILLATRFITVAASEGDSTD